MHKSNSKERKKQPVSHFVFVILLHIVPFLLLLIPFFLLFDVSLKNRGKTAQSTMQQKQEPNMVNLEKKLKKLIENNQMNAQISTLQKELQQTKSNTVSAYINLNKEDLKGFHLFQLIFSLIKNNAEDEKIIKILHHYLPSCATTHLYAMLHSFKVFLNISYYDKTQKELLRDLNQNRVRTTLLYLEKKINQTLNQVPQVVPAMQQLIIDRAVVYGLVFASFCEFYDNAATEKILRLSSQLSPTVFKYWHQIPRYHQQEFAWLKNRLPENAISHSKN